VKIPAAAWLTTAQDSLYTPHALSDSGSRLFFNSFDALVPRDNNAQQDVYEWEAPNSGGCAKVNGCINLISSGESPQKSEFVDADPAGDSVFFETTSSLLPQDPGLIDIYVARVEGGFPQPAPPASCEGEACQAPPAPPADITPASSVFDGAGNAVQKSVKRKHRKKKAHRGKRHKNRATKDQHRVRHPRRAS
jgi:hypothetical protein